MEHVFISYKRNDRQFVSVLEQKLKDADFNTWTDDQIRAGEEWRIRIDDAIKQAFALVVVMTPEARASEYVTYEWSFAMGMGIPVIPILLVATELHPKLSQLHYLDFTVRYGEPWDQLIERLREIHKPGNTTSIRVPIDAPEAIKRAVEALDSIVPTERGAAIGSLARMQHPLAEEVLLQALNHTLIAI